MKKALALILSMVMIIGIALPVSAAELYAEKVYMMRGQGGGFEYTIEVGGKEYTLELFGPATEFTADIVDAVREDPSDTVEVSVHSSGANQLSVKAKAPGAAGNDLLDITISRIDGEDLEFTYDLDMQYVCLINADGNRIAQKTGPSLGSLPFGDSYDDALDFPIVGTEWFYESIWDDEGGEDGTGGYVGSHGGHENEGESGGYQSLIYWDGDYLNLLLEGKWTGFFNPEDYDEWLANADLSQFLVDHVAVGLNFFKGYNAIYRVPILAAEKAIFSDNVGTVLRGNADSYFTASADVDEDAETAVVEININVRHLIDQGLVDEDSFENSAALGIFVTVYDVKYFDRPFEHRGTYDKDDVKNFPGSIWSGAILDIWCNLDGGNSFDAAGYLALSGGPTPLAAAPVDETPDADGAAETDEAVDTVEEDIDEEAIDEVPPVEDVAPAAPAAPAKSPSTGMGGTIIFVITALALTIIGITVVRKKVKAQ